MARKTFIFDYDDTLAKSVIYYIRAKLKFAHFAAERLGPLASNEVAILQLQEKTDIANVPKFGFSKERFPTSMRETYAAICAMHGITPPAEDLQEAYRIGTEAFDRDEYHRNGLLPGARETLDFLARKGDELILYTKGDTQVQWSKIDATRIGRYFSDIHVVADKDADGMTRIVGKRDPARVWKVGNGLRSDIYPALEAGIGAIYIPWETWGYERQHNGEPEHPRYVKLARIDEIVERYETLP